MVRKIIKTLPFGVLVENTQDVTETNTDGISESHTPTHSPISQSSAHIQNPPSTGRRRSPRQRIYDKLQVQLVVAEAISTYLDTLGFGRITRLILAS